MRLIVLAALLLASSIALAQDAACDPAQRDCRCERGWGCWELLYSTPGTILGVEGSASRVTSSGDAQSDDRRLDGAVLATYATEHYGTRNGLSGHFRAFGSIGGGSAGNEGRVGGAIDFGYRLDITEVSGPFARLGANAMLLGNEALSMSMFEPLQARVGYQFLDGGTLIETGLTGGVVAVGRYRAGDHGGRALGRAPELGAYTALHLADYRFDASVSQLEEVSTGSHTPLDLVRLGLCGYLRPAALCGTLLLVRGDVDIGQRRYRRMASLYLGLAIGLVP